MKLEKMMALMPGVTLLGPGDIFIEWLNLCNRTTKYKSILSYTTNSDWVKVVENNLAVRALICTERDRVIYEPILRERDGALLLSEAPEESFYLLHEQLCRCGEFYQNYNFPPKIGEQCYIAPSAVIENGVILEDGVMIGHNTVVRAGTVIERNVSIGCNSSIGSPGCQVIRIHDVPHNITHVGGVRICEGVTLGDNVCIAKSLFEEPTYIGSHSIVGDLTIIAHNCRVEKNAYLSPGVILCGSVTIRQGCWISPGSCLNNKVVVGENAHVGLGCVVVNNVAADSQMYPIKAQTRRQLEKQAEQGYIIKEMATLYKLNQSKGKSEMRNEDTRPAAHQSSVRPGGGVSVLADCLRYKTSREGWTYPVKISAPCSTDDSPCSRRTSVYRRVA